MKKLLLIFLCAALFAEECPPLFNVWSSYTNFYLDDDRSVGSIGTVQGQSLLFALGVLMTPCTTGTAYAIYEKADTTNPLNRPNLTSTEQGFVASEGWGAGGTLSYNLTPVWSAYVDYSYVWFRQNQATRILNAQFASIDHTFDGQRWKLTAGLNALQPFCGVVFAGSVNYNYIAAHQGGSFFAPSAQTITSSSSVIGIANANGALYLLPDCALNPFVNGGISYDTNRSSDPSFLLDFAVAPALLEGVPRPRFEWNAGAGVTLIKGGFTFATSYLHRQRVGPITTDSITFYGSATF